MMIGKAVGRAARQFRRLADARLASFGVKAGYMPVLITLMEREGRTQKMLVREVGIEQPTMVATLSRMERDGIIERRVDVDDMRVCRIFLSAATREQMSAIRTTIDAFSAEAVGDLDAQELAILQGALEKVTRRIETMLTGEVTSLGV